MKKAYTLSEVLVVIMVLGIVLSCILPAVLRSAPSRAHILYKKSFYAVQEAAKKLISDSSVYYEDEYDDKHNGLFTDSTDTSFCELLANKMNVTGEISCTNNGADVLNFTTTNGINWYGVAQTFTTDDANGDYKDIKVECNRCKYRIRIYADGRVGTNESWTDDINDNKCGNKRENDILKEAFKFVDKD